MKKFVCSVCGYVYEGEAAPENVQYVEHLLRNSQSRQAR